jgi:hypothetical protein
MVSGRGMRASVLLVVLVLAGGCAGRGDRERRVVEPYLLVWAGDADRNGPDFLAVIGADPQQETYGKVLKTYPVGSRGNEPNALNDAPRADGRVFATGVLTDRTFVFDLRDPLAGKVLYVDQPGEGWRLRAPGGVVSLPNGSVAIACADQVGYAGRPRELLTRPGGLVQLRADGRPVREVIAEAPFARGFIVAPNGIAASPAAGRLVTTSTGHGYASTTRIERMPGITVQVWKLDGLTLLHSIVLQAGPRGEENLAPLTPTFMHERPVLFVDTEGGGLYVSDSLGAAQPVFLSAYDFGPGASPGGAAVTPNDRYYVVALTDRGRVVSLDLSDPRRPRPAASVAVPGGPFRLTMNADGSRVAVSNYTIDVPGFTREGDHRVNIIRIDPATGRMAVDPTFRDEVTGRVGVDFDRARWPHGATGPARPAGLLFVAPARPPEGD